PRDAPPLPRARVSAHVLRWLQLPGGVALPGGDSRRSAARDTRARAARRRLRHDRRDTPTPAAIHRLGAGWPRKWRSFRRRIRSERRNERDAERATSVSNARAAWRSG